jgi:hypothetical protein
MHSPHTTHETAYSGDPHNHTSPVHGTRAAFEHDRLRDRRLARAGYRTIRLTPNALRYDEEAIVADLDALLSRSRASSKLPRRSSSSAASAW